MSLLKASPPLKKLQNMRVRLEIPQKGNSLLCAPVSSSEPSSTGQNATEKKERNKEKKPKKNTPTEIFFFFLGGGEGGSGGWGWK